MERRADPAGVDNPKEDSKAWQAIRRALGRLASRVGVRVVSDAEREILVPVEHTTLSFPPPLLPGGDAWKPAAVSVPAPVPSAGTGLQESDLLPCVSLAAGDYALAPPLIAALPNAAGAAALAEVPLAWPLEVSAVPEGFLRLPASPVRIGTAALPAGMQTAAQPLRGWNLPLPPVNALRLPRVECPRVRWGGDSVLRRMPLTRQSGAIGGEPAARRRLAETVHLDAEDVTLLGVYPDVPILAVERIVVEDEGRRLKLWLKPEVLRGRSGSHRITLLVGRQTATGKMLQAAL